MQISPQIEITTQLYQDSYLNKETIIRSLPDNITNTCNNKDCISPIEILPNVYIDKGNIIDRIV